MNITKITTDDKIQYDPFLIETIVKPKDKDITKPSETAGNSNWNNRILNDTLSNLENNIQKADDSSPLSYKSSPPIQDSKTAIKIINDIDVDDLTDNINQLFNNLNVQSISKLFVEAADIKL